MGATGHAFVLLGEPLAVELVNTRPMRDGVRRELLASDADAAAWGHLHAGELPAEATPPSDAELRGLRDAIESLFDASLAERLPPPESITAVNEAVAAAPLLPELGWTERPSARTVAAGAARGPAVTLAAIARSAVEVLADPRGPRLRRCEAPGCVLLFVATNPRRRWCSTASCGNRVRVARHYERTRWAP